MYGLGFRSAVYGLGLGAIHGFFFSCVRVLFVYTDVFVYTGVFVYVQHTHANVFLSLMS